MLKKCVSNSKYCFITQENKNISLCQIPLSLLSFQFVEKHVAVAFNENFPFEFLYVVTPSTRAKFIHLINRPEQNRVSG